MEQRLSRGVGVGACVLAAACGGGGGGGPSSGVFLDSAVGGLGFASGAAAGLTDAAGTFQAEGAARIEFSVGDVVLGQVGALKPVVTPVDLVPGAVDETDPQVTNLARFLQSLDTDLDPTNGITIDPSVTAAAAQQSLDFTLGQTAFEAAAQALLDTLTAGLPGGPHTLVSVQDAQQHLASTLLGVVAGRYDGTFSGDDAGTFRVFVDRSGTLYGYANSVFEGWLGLSGSAATDGEFVAGEVTSGATFEGSIQDGTLAGTWEILPDVGTFLGSQVSGVDAVLDQALLASLVGTYTGTFVTPFEIGPVTIVLDANGDLTAPPPDEQLAMTVISTSGGSVQFAGLTIEGCEIAGTIDAGGAMAGSYQNPLDGETGTFTATLVP